MSCSSMSWRSKFTSLCCDICPPSALCTCWTWLTAGWRVALGHSGGELRAARCQTRGRCRFSQLRGDGGVDGVQQQPARTLEMGVHEEAALPWVRVNSHCSLYSLLLCFFPFFPMYVATTCQEQFHVFQGNPSFCAANFEVHSFPGAKPQ